MARFVTRRLITMVLLLFVISLVTFLLFVVALPGGNPAALIAGRLATPAEVHLISVRYGFDKPIWVQYVKTMGNIFDGSAYSYQQGFNVLAADQAGPAGDAVAGARGRASSGCSPRSRSGRWRRSAPGKYTDRVLTVLSMVGVSMPPFLLGAVLIYFVGYKAGIIPLSGYVPLSTNPWQWFWHLRRARGSRCRCCSSASTRACCAARSSTR